MNVADSRDQYLSTQIGNLEQMQSTQHQMEWLSQDFEEFENTFLNAIEPVFIYKEDSMEVSPSSQHYIIWLSQDFEEFENSHLMPYEENVFEDFNVWDLVQGTQDSEATEQFAFEEFESSYLSPYEENDVEGINIWDLIDIDDSEAVEQYIFGGTEEFTQDIDSRSPVMDYGSAGGIGITASYLNYGRVANSDGNGFGWDGVGVTGYIEHHDLCRDSSIGVNSWRQGDNGILPRRRTRRKYRGVVESDEARALRLEAQKIKCREAAALAHIKKQEREAKLMASVQKLRQKNNYLRNFIMYSGIPRTDVPPKPLKRTISGPV